MMTLSEPDGVAPGATPGARDELESSTAFSTALLDHCNHPRNVGSFPPADDAVGTGWAEATHCQDVVKLQIRVADDADVIADARFKTFGCAAAIACSSLATELVKGRPVAEAAKVDRHVLGRLLALAPRRLDCAATVEQAVALAVADYRKKRENRS
jgi:nitrogen fixation NifU-like protein